LRSLTVRRIAPRHAVAGALALGTILPATALALGAPTPGAAPIPADPLVLRAPSLDDDRLRLGQRAAVHGRLAAAAAGRTLALQFAARGHRWRSVETTTVDRRGRYRFHVRPRRSGALRVIALPPDATTAGGAEAIAAQAPLQSRTRRVAVAAKLVVGRRGHDVGVGDAVRVRGVLLPRSRGRTVVVEAGAHGRWRKVARSRTRANGHFAARVVAQRLGTQKLRVRFSGDRRNAGTRRHAGALQAYRAGLASWYGLYGNRTACGQTLGYGTLGVAHKTLPCGTEVTIRYRGREVTVPVIDRGPFTGGREWDLTGATARRLGFGGVDTVWTTV
jgi:rare lipoprotein A